MKQDRNGGLSLEELEGQHACALPPRDLLIALTLLGIPLAGLEGVTVNVNTSGPRWLL